MTKISALLAVVHVPLMWSLVLFLLGLGILGLAKPLALRNVMAAFTRNRPVRAIGVFMVVLGTEMFMQASNAAAPVLVKSLGVLLFIDGGVRVIVPTLSVIFMERIKSAQLAGLRVLGFLLVVAAWLFYLAAKLPPPPPAA